MLTTDSNSEKPSILKTTREAKGLTLEIVHEATKIPMDSLKAIEEGYSVRILSPFYYRGFIKIYAEFLGLDVQEMYRQYGLNQPSKPASSPVSSSVKVNKVTPQPNVVLDQILDGLPVVFSPRNLKLIFKVICFLVLVFVLFRMAGCVVSHFHKKTVPVAQNVKFYNDVQENQPQAPVVAVKHMAVVAPSEDDKVEVAVRALKDTYLQVKTDGNVVFQMTLSKGSMENWTADKKIELSGRNIEQLDMEVNGKHIGPLGGGERRIRRVLITPEGLTVKK